MSSELETWPEKGLGGRGAWRGSLPSSRVRSPLSVGGSHKGRTPGLSTPQRQHPGWGWGGGPWRLASGNGGRVEWEHPGGNGTEPRGWIPKGDPLSSLILPSSVYPQSVCLSVFIKACKFHPPFGKFSPHPLLRSPFPFLPSSFPRRLQNQFSARAAGTAPSGAAGSLRRL